MLLAGFLVICERFIAQVDLLAFACLLADCLNDGRHIFQYLFLFHVVCRTKSCL
jgi:hypothetical protein